MDLAKMISELEAEKARLDEAILALERLSAGKASRRGRPARWLEEAVEEASEPRDASDVVETGNAS